jgi:hypothetical protein
VTPEALSAKNEDGHAEDVIAVRLLDAGIQRRGTVAAEIGAVRVGRMAELGDQRGNFF